MSKMNKTRVGQNAKLLLSVAVATLFSGVGVECKPYMYNNIEIEIADTADNKFNKGGFYRNRDKVFFSHIGNGAFIVQNFTIDTDNPTKVLLKKTDPVAGDPEIPEIFSSDSMYASPSLIGLAPDGEVCLIYVLPYDSNLNDASKSEGKFRFNDKLFYQFFLLAPEDLMKLIELYTKGKTEEGKYSIDINLYNAQKEIEKEKYKASYKTSYVTKKYLVIEKA